MKLMNCLLALSLCAAGSFAAAQTSNTEPSFEVATIKLSNAADNRAMMMFGEGKMQIKNLPLKNLITFAYDIKSDALLTNLPDWANSQRYDVEARQDEEGAKAMEKLPEDERGRASRRMVQKLLEERLNLKLVKEEKEQPVYALVVAKSGVKMKAATPVTEGQEPAAGPGGPRMRRGMMMNGRGELTGNDATTQMIASMVAHMPESNNRVVVDRTGLTGHYDFTLKWTPERPAPAFRGADGGATPSPAEDTGGPTLFTALEEQLGLKLESVKDKVTSYRVASIDKPTEN